MTDGPLLWYLNRSTGMVLLVLFTLTTVLGILSTRGRAGRGVPVFVTQALHRNVAVLSVVLLAAHVTTAVVDTYVDIRWWHALVPWGATYEPLYFELGVVALDLTAIIAVTSMLRARLAPRGWRLVHLTSYAAWVVSVIHGIGIGTDLRQDERWAWLVTAGCVSAVLAASTWRLGHVAAGRRVAARATSDLPSRAGSGR
jgi:methionine sulfoxide reductase heme-binding subunit